MQHEATCAELVEILSVTRKTVALWAKSGIMEKTSHGKYDLKNSLRNWAAYQKRGGGEMIATQIGSERARLLKAQADKAELGLKVERGDLVPFAEGVATAQTMCHLFRASLLSFQTRLGGRLNLSRPDSEIVYEQACEILTELSQANDYADNLQAVAQEAVEKELTKGDARAA